MVGCRGPGEDRSKLKLQIDPQLATSDWVDGPRHEASVTEIETQSKKYAEELFAPNPMPTEMPSSAKNRLATSVKALESGSAKGRPAWSDGIPEPPRVQAHDLPKPWPIQVQQGESLRTIARWAGTTTTRVLNDNKETLGRRKWLRAGDRLHITMSANQKVSFDKTRERHSQTRLDNYFATRYIAKVVVYRVNRHESVSDAARRYGDVPLWLLQEFNKRDFTRLRRGAEILIPVVKRYNKADGLPPALELIDASGEVLSSEKKVQVEARMNDDLMGRARLAIDDGSFFERGSSLGHGAPRGVLPTYGQFNQQPAAPASPVVQQAGRVPAVATHAVAPPPKPREVLVKAGETLGKYAKWSGISVRAIKRANPGLNPDRIRIGMRIRLPLNDDAWGRFVLARAGRKARLTTPVAQPTATQPAQAVPVGLKVPVATPKAEIYKPHVYKAPVAPTTLGTLAQAPSPVKTAPSALLEVFYTVKSGDIASKIARKNKLTLAELSALNPTRNLHLLKIGQKLRIQ